MIEIASGRRRGHPGSPADRPWSWVALALVLAVMPAVAEGGEGIAPPQPELSPSAAAAGAPEGKPLLRFEPIESPVIVADVASGRADDWSATERLEWRSTNLEPWRRFGGSGFRERRLVRRDRGELRRFGWMVDPSAPVLTLVPWNDELRQPRAGHGWRLLPGEDAALESLVVRVLREGGEWVVVATATDRQGHDTEARLRLPPDLGATPP